MSEERTPEELLEATHEFPGVFQIKAIGTNSSEFADQVVAAVTAELTDPSELEYTARTTPGGRHMALTLHIHVQSASQVRLIYGRLRGVEGLTFLL